MTNFSRVFDSYYRLHSISEESKLNGYSYGERSVSPSPAPSTRSSSVDTKDHNHQPQFGRVEVSPFVFEQDLKRRTLWERLTKRSVVLRAQVTLTVTVLIINIGWTIWAGLTYGTEDGIGTIFTGDCGRSQLLNVYLHIAINVLSTLLLGTSNYCMQLISAPTREEIDKAHAAKSWLDIGVPSARNVWKLKFSNKLVWCGLAVTSAVLHLFWNSAVFYSFPTYEYRVAIASSDFQNHNQTWPSRMGFDFDSLRRSANDLEYLSNTDCINRYIEPLNSGRDVIVVTKRTAEQNNNKTLLTSEVAGGVVWYFEEYWICSSPEIYSAMLPGGCTADVISHFLGNWTVASGDIPPATNSSLGSGTVEVDHCLSAGLNDSQNQCSVGFSTYIMAIVIVMNVLKCAFVFFVHWKSGKYGAIVTLGDAIASFLQEPDHHTEQMCLTTKRHFMGKDAWKPQAIEWRPKKTRWYHATTKRRFWITIGIYAATFIAITGLLAASVAGRVRDHRSISLTALLAQGLGNPDPQELLSSKSAPQTLLASVVMANVFQLLYSSLYYMYNSVLSCMLVALEWSRYSSNSSRNNPNNNDHPKSLRVSNPTGAQRSSYFLTIPYRYGIPLLGVSSLLQWLVSQSIFLIRTINYDPTQTNTIASQSNRIGFAPIGIVASYGLTWLMFFVLLLLAFFKTYPGGGGDEGRDGGSEKGEGEGMGIPLVSTCSAAISAACHRAPGDYDAWLLPVRWGVVLGSKVRERTGSRGRFGGEGKEGEGMGMEVGHCSFTTARDVNGPVVGRWYA